MYYVEKLINGKLHYKNSPESDWEEFTVLMLNNRIKELESRLLEAVSDKQPTVRR